MVALTVVDLVTVIDVDANTAVVGGAVDEGDVEATMAVQGKKLFDRWTGRLADLLATKC